MEDLGGSPGVEGHQRAPARQASSQLFGRWTLDRRIGHLASCRCCRGGADDERLRTDASQNSVSGGNQMVERQEHIELLLSGNVRTPR